MMIGYRTCRLETHRSFLIDDAEGAGRVDTAFTLYPARAAQILSSSSPGPMLVPLVTMPKQPEPFCAASRAAEVWFLHPPSGKTGASVT